MTRSTQLPKRVHELAELIKIARQAGNLEEAAELGRLMDQLTQEMEDGF
jgi:hypothetical protein